MSEREAAWDAIHEALSARWHVGPVTYDPGRLAYSVTARGPHPGRGKVSVTVSGTGEDEIAALRDLDDRVRGREDSGGLSRRAPAAGSARLCQRSRGMDARERRPTDDPGRVGGCPGALHRAIASGRQRKGIGGFP
jgi:hypothetical protein